MKKKVLWTIGLATAMAAGMALTSFAGWVQDGTTWYYYGDRSGDLVTDEWVQSGNYWYYLGKDGRMVTNRFIDETYYVDGSGARITNAWQMIYGDEDETGWRYFGNNGKAYEEGMKEINGVWYHFDGGIMSTGWVEHDGNTYYFKDSGARISGWKWLPDPDEDEWGEYWYYFTSTGKLIHDAEKEIDDVNYIFDNEGRMLTGWVNPDDYSSSGRDDLSGENTGELLFFESHGGAAEGWHYMTALDESDDYWYYFKDGKAYSTSNRTTRIGEYGIAKIDGEYYCFNEYGQMVTGLIELNDNEYYHFDEDDGTMSTGRVNIDNEDFENQEFYFATSGSVGERGKGVTGVKEGRLYNHGMLVAAEEGMKYEVKHVDGDPYLVNEDGKVKTTGTVKDADGVRYKVTKQDGRYLIEIVED